jgi:hypothetical protein
MEANHVLRGVGAFNFLAEKAEGRATGGVEPD